MEKMEMKNNCQLDYIKDAFDKLYERVMPYIDDSTHFADAASAFKELDKKVHSEIYILKKCLAERDRAVEAGIARSKEDRERISDLEKELNYEHKHGEDLVDANRQLASENVDLKSRLTLLETSRTCWRSRAQHAEKRVTDLNKKIHDLEEENANLRVTPDDANAIEVLRRENRVLRCDNKKLAAACEDNKRLREVIDTLEKEINTLKKNIQELEEDNETLRSKLEEADIHKRPWHGDGNAMTGAWTCCENLAKAIEFQNKKIEELEAEKARLKEAVDIQKTTFKKLEENVDLSYGHEFEFGDEVFVPWSCDPYMYIKSGMMYNPRTERLVYVGKDQHLKWFGEKFAIV